MADKTKAGTEVVQAKHVPFENDPELKRICNRLASTGSQLASWIGSREPRTFSRLERLMIAVHKGS